MEIVIAIAILAVAAASAAAGYHLGNRANSALVEHLAIEFDSIKAERAAHRAEVNDLIARHREERHQLIEQHNEAIERERAANHRTINDLIVTRASDPPPPPRVVTKQRDDDGNRIKDIEPIGTRLIALLEREDGSDNPLAPPAPTLFNDDLAAFDIRHTKAGL